MKKEFGPKYFKELTKCDTYQLSILVPGYLESLFDHGFIANAACVWSRELEGHEFAIISRTYLSEIEINNPPDGIKCVKIPWCMGDDDPGIAIATVVVRPTQAAIDTINLCRNLPAKYFTGIMSLNMAREHFTLISIDRSNMSICTDIIKKELPFLYESL